MNRVLATCKNNCGAHMYVETTSFWYKGYCPRCTGPRQLAEFYAEKREARQKARAQYVQDHNFRAFVLWIHLTSNEVSLFAFHGSENGEC